MSQLIDAQRTLALIERHEGREKYPYMDTTGNVTIGVGWNLTARGLPDTVIDELHKRAYAEAVNQAMYYPWFKRLNGPRKAVIISMIYNMGADTFADFEQMRDDLVNEDYTSAAEEMLDSLWASQVGRRADELARMMVTGRWLHD